MVRTLTIALLFAAFWPVPTARAQQLQLQGGDVVITIIPIGSAPFWEEVDTSTRLRWKKLNGSGTLKVVVETMALGQDYALFVTPIDVRNGLPTGEIELSDGMIPADFVRDILPGPPPNGRATLRYRARVTAADGNSATLGDDRHTVTYTIIEQ